MRVPAAGLTCAGRTDAGVHARGQVAHVDVPGSAYAHSHSSRLVRRLAAVLPHDVRVFDVREVPDAFDARFSALSRRYVYRLSDAPYGVDPLRRHEILWSQRALDLAPMNEASTAMLGEHDFAAFCRRREGASTIRTLLSFTWERDTAGFIAATVEANAFCHNMVRSLVGALLAVGAGQQPVSWPARLLAQRERDPGVHVVPPHGLTLEQVTYPPDAHLGERLVRTRQPSISGDVRGGS